MKENFVKAKRIAIDILHLEHEEHIGIASVVKSLITLLNKNAAEIYLITSFI